MPVLRHGHAFLLQLYHLRIPKLERGKAIARLVPAEQADQTEIGLVIDKLRLLRKKVKLRGLDWKGLRDDGRR